MTAARPARAGLRRKAKEMAYALGIPLYLRDDGALSQFPPVGLEPPDLIRWERIDPAPGAAPTPHGHGRPPAAAATP